MLTITEIVDKLYLQPKCFEQCMDAENYCRAKWIYIKAVFVADFIEMDQEAADKLMEAFGKDRVLEAFGKAGGPDDTGCRPRKEDDPAGRHIPTSL